MLKPVSQLQAIYNEHNGYRNLFEAGVSVAQQVNDMQGSMNSTLHVSIQIIQQFITSVYNLVQLQKRPNSARLCLVRRWSQL